jgi:hypothetical protein
MPNMTDEEYLQHDFRALRKHFKTASKIRGDQISEEMADRRLVEHASKAMARKLSIARQKGRGGWWDEEACSVEQLRAMLAEHVEKGDMRDVMNFAAMIYVRQIVDG